MKQKGEMGSGAVSVPLEKIKDLGAHYHKYYQLETSFFKSSVDNEMLTRLWSEYWLATLSSSPILNNDAQISNQIVDIKQKLLQASNAAGGAQNDAEKQYRTGQNLAKGMLKKKHGKRGREIHRIFAESDETMGFGGGIMGVNSGKSGLGKDAIKSLKESERVSSQMACECNHALIIEALKRGVFSKRK